MTPRGTSHDLLRAANGTGTWSPTTRIERRCLQDARETVAAVRQATIEADGAFALAGHIMHGVVELDDERQSLAGGDPGMAALLGTIEATAIRQVKGLQSRLYQW